MTPQAKLNLSADIANWFSTHACVEDFVVPNRLVSYLLPTYGPLGATESDIREIWHSMVSNWFDHDDEPMFVNSLLGQFLTDHKDELAWREGSSPNRLKLFLEGSNDILFEVVIVDAHIYGKTNFTYE